MAAPQWAQELLLGALGWWEGQGEKAPLVSLTWRRGRHPYSSGRLFVKEGRLLVTAGTKRVDAKLVLLHETAHALLSEGALPDTGHTKGFWEVAWQLYRWAGLPIRYCQRREYAYRKGAAVAYRSRGDEAPTEDGVGGERWRI